MYNPYDNLKFPKRKHPRLREYDYSLPGCYFITICTDKKKCIFGNPGELNTFGLIAEKGIKNIPDHFQECKIEKYVVMPNHIHMILSLPGNGCKLTAIVGSYKSFVSKQIHLLEPKISVWQSSYYDHVIRDNHGFQQIWSYIDRNPMNWKDDDYFL